MFKNILSLGALGFLALACGGGSSSSEPSSTASVSGTVFASQVRQAKVQFKDVNNQVIAGPTLSGNLGEYQLLLPASALGTNLILECSGGNYIDEATGALTNAGNLSAYFAASTLAHQAVASATPATTLVREMMRSGNSQAEAKNIFKNAFGYEPNASVNPTDARSPQAGATAASNLEGQRAAQFSQLTYDLRLSPQQQFDLLEKLALDLTDGVLDGKKNSTSLSVGATALPRDMSSKLNDASFNFSSSGNDLTGLLPENPIFNKVAYTSGGNYKVEWISTVMGTMDAGSTTGKSNAQLRVTQVETGAGVTSLFPKITPTMKMNGHEHSTPFEAITEMGSGNYNLNIYYLMASSMGSTNMGTWILSIDCGNGEVAKFYPKVGMKMNGSDVVKFKGIDPDMISVHTHDTSANHSHESRTYLLFPEKCELGMSGHNLYLFAAAKESLSSFPALSTGNTLNAGRGHSLAIAQSSIGLSYNGINYSSAELGQGHYVIKNIQGLTSGNAVTFSVNMQINNSYKTTNGLASGNVDSTLTITPSTSTSM